MAVAILAAAGNQMMTIFGTWLLTTYYSNQVAASRGLKTIKHADKNVHIYLGWPIECWLVGINILKQLQNYRITVPLLLVKLTKKDSRK